MVNKRCYNSPLCKNKEALLQSLVRQRQAAIPGGASSSHSPAIAERGYAGMTIEAIAHRAEVSAQSVYGIFKSKTGILTELLDQSTFGPDYEEAVRKALGASDPELVCASQPQLPGKFTSAERNV